MGLVGCMIPSHHHPAAPQKDSASIRVCEKREESEHVYCGDISLGCRFANPQVSYSFSVLLNFLQPLCKPSKGPPPSHTVPYHL